VSPVTRLYKNRVGGGQVYAPRRAEATSRRDLRPDRGARAVPRSVAGGRRKPGVDVARADLDAPFMAERPSNDDRLKAIRAHADGTMRYYATAFLRETEENRDLMRAYMGITANILALLDGSSLDDRSMMSGRERIIQQYIEQARSDPYEPGNCSFCGERPVVAWFEGPSFRTFVRSSVEVRAEEAWLTCQVCLGLVETNDREGLVERGLARWRRRDREEGRTRRRARRPGSER
jgi:hypothetical protein